MLIGKPFSPAGRVVAWRLPGGELAMTTHRGDYAALGHAHEAVHRFAEGRGRELAGPRWEIYGHMHDDPRALTTEVYYLLR